jgi:hypothetical protein
VQTDKGLRLRRGAMLKTDVSQNSAEVVRVTRSYQFTRWIDGSSHLWAERRKAVGRSEGSSRLLSDSLDAKD